MKLRKQVLLEKKIYNSEDEFQNMIQALLDISENKNNMDDEIIPPVRDQKPIEYAYNIVKSDVIIHHEQPVAIQASTHPLGLSTVARFSNKVEMPEVRGFSMRKAMTALRQAGLKIKIQGSGKVAWQSPKPGTILNKGSTCIVGLK